MNTRFVLVERQSRSYFSIDPVRLFNGKPQATTNGIRSRLRLAVKRNTNGIPFNSAARRVAHPERRVPAAMRYRAAAGHLERSDGSLLDCHGDSAAVKTSIVPDCNCGPGGKWKRPNPRP